MPANIRVVQTVFFILCWCMLALQSGCGTSGGGGEAPASNPAAELRMELSTLSGSTTVVADGRTALPIRLQVRNGLGVGLSGMAVTFATTAGTLSTAPAVRAASSALHSETEIAIARQESASRLTVTTDASGTAEVLLTPGTRVGTALVTADVQGFRTSIDIAFVAGVPARVQLNASPTMVNAGGLSTLTATVTDVNGNPNNGQTVIFSFTTNTSGATLSPTSGTTDSNGQVTAMYTAGTMAGADTIRVQVMSNTLTTMTSITVTALPAGTSTMMVTSIAVTNGATGPVPANGVNSVDITATVQGASGPLAGEVVTFTTTAGVFATSMATTATAASNSNGMARVQLIAPTSMATATVTASAGGFSATTMVVFEASPASVQLIVDSPQLESAQTLTNPPSITLTALVKDAANNVLSGIPVRFSADSGNIQVTSGTTGVAGTATALLTTLGNAVNRPITVTASAGSHRSTTNIQVTGTTLNVSGATSLVVGATTRLTILLRDSGGRGIQNQPITIHSALGNDLSAMTLTTDAAGQARVDVTARVPGTDTLAVSGPGVMTTVTLSISADEFEITVPDSAMEVPLHTAQAVTAHWERGGAPQVGQMITFFATRGNFTTTGTCPTATVPTITAMTDNNGDATVNICSDNAGPAVITALADVTTGPSSQVGIEFVATTPALLLLQATATSLAPNQQSVITAVVLDAQDNLVKNRTVSFSVSDVSRGQISPGFGITDSFGRASTVFTASPVTSGRESVVITAQDEDGAVANRITLTVAQRPLFVTLGTGNVVQLLGDVQYALPYCVLVKDVNGNPIENAIVELSEVSLRYQKGFYARFFDASGACTGWGKILTVQFTPGTPDPDNIDQACQNEDSNLNGILDSSEDLNNNGQLDPGEDRNMNGILDSGEDHNRNGKLDPRNVATVPRTVTTDATGFACFNVLYTRDSTWVEIELTARATVVGSEGVSRARFFLPGAVSDFNNCQVAPPGQISPFGIATTCACDEKEDTLCPTFAGSNSITITSASGTMLPGAGGTFAFTVSGGTQIGYDLTTSTGTLSATTNVPPGGFTLTIPANPSNTTPLPISIVARDTLTGLTGSLTVTQSPSP